MLEHLQSFLHGSMTTDVYFTVPNNCYIIHETMLTIFMMILTIKIISEVNTLIVTC